MDPRLGAAAQARGGVLTSSMAADAGRSEHDLVGMCRAGELVRVRRDAYVLGDAWAAADGATR